ncbi:hypothetical protein, partial [Peribacillus butanolivorans]|uniref:hypothetical protein n=1 Tax=Peribacillus butanolivorans TaxID=421767 RepID=UPI0036799112
RRGGSRTARGKRVPGVEINVRIFKTLKKTVDKLDFHRVCLQSESNLNGYSIFGNLRELDVKKTTFNKQCESSLKLVLLN